MLQPEIKLSKSCIKIQLQSNDKNECIYYDMMWIYMQGDIYFSKTAVNETQTL